MKVITSEDLKQAVLNYAMSAAAVASSSPQTAEVRATRLFGSGAYKAICHVIDALYARPDAIELEARLAVAQEGLNAAVNALSALRAQVIESLDVVDTTYCENCQEAVSDAVDKGTHWSTCPLGKLRAAVTAEESLDTRDSAC